MRERSYSYSPEPRGYDQRGRSPSPRGHYGGHRRDLPTSLLVRNLPRDCRADDLRRPFSQFGPLKDVYIPRDYYTGYSRIEELNLCMSLEVIQVLKKLKLTKCENVREQRGFGFVQYIDPEDAADAKYEMDRRVFLGRELTVVFAEENRKKPSEMRARERLRSRSYDYRSPPRHSHSRYSRSPSPRYHRSRYSRSRSRSYSPSPRRRHYSRSVSPRDERRHRGRTYSPDSPYY